MASGTNLPSGWKMSAAATTADWLTGTNTTTVTQVASSGSPATAGRYNWGTTAGTDRAIGFMTDGSYASPNTILAQLHNQTGATITSLTITFQMERYRINTSGFYLQFFSSSTGSSWTSQPAGDISAAVFTAGASSYTFTTPQTVYKTVTITGLSIANGTDYYLRWVFGSAGTSGQGLGLDNVSVDVNLPGPSLTATLTDALTGDNNNNTKANEGDKLTYTATIKNEGAAATGVTYTAPLNNLTQSGTTRTSALALNDNFSTGVGSAVSGNVLSNDFGLPSLSVVSHGSTEDATGSASDNGGTVTMNASGSFTYTPPAGFVGNDRFAYKASTGTAPDDIAIVNIAVGTIPSAGAAESFPGIIGNVFINQSAPGLLTNDMGSGLRVGAVQGNAGSVGFATTSANNGNVIVFADGSFTYNPAPGFEGSDQFTYTIDNGFSSPATVTVNLAVSGMIWFIQNGGAAGDGRLSGPFNSIAAFQAVNNGAGNNPAAGDYIFIRENASAYTTSAIILLQNQKLIGQDATVALGGAPGVVGGGVGTITGFDLPSYSAALPANNTGAPTVNLSNSATIVTLSTSGGNLIRGLTLTPSGGNGIFLTGSSTGNHTATEVIIAASSLAAGVNIQANPYNGTFNYTSGSITNTGLGIAFNVTSNSATINCSVPITQSGNGTMVSVVNHTTGTITFQTGILNATNGNGLQFNNADGVYNFNGTTTLNGGNAGIDILSGSAGTFSFSANTSITSPSGTAFNVNASSPNLTYSGNITQNTSGQQVVNIDATSSNTITFNTGTITGGASSTGINIANANGGNVTFSNGFTLGTSLSRMTNQAVTISKGTGNGNGTFALGTVSIFTDGQSGLVVTDIDGTINSTAGTIDATNARAINIAGPSGVTTLSLTLTQVSSTNSATNGITIANTNGSFTITGDAGSTNNSSGGTIQNTTGHGIALSVVQGISLDQLTIQTTSGSGVNGTGVTNFSFTNGTISGSGDALGESNISFNGNGAGTGNNINGTLTLTGSTLTNAFDHGIDVRNDAGTISNAVITNNSFTSTNSTTTSKGSAISLQLNGTATAVANLNQATISTNTIANFPSGSGIIVLGGNTNAAGPLATVGTPNNATNIITITNNTVHGESAANRLGASAIVTGISGRGQGNFNISDNGTAVAPLTNFAGSGIRLLANGAATVTGTISNNYMVGNNLNGAPGIESFADQFFATTDAPSLTVTINNNTVKAIQGNGIRAGAVNSNGSARLKIQSNSVDAPTAGTRPGIRVDSGGSLGGDTNVCLNISNNTSAGSGGIQGIGLHKQGTIPTTNDFAVHLMVATSTPNVETYINGLNPAGGGTVLLSATSGFTNCTNN